MPITLRPFHLDDCERLVEIENANHPDDPQTVDGTRHYLQSFDSSTYDRLRLAVEEPAGQVVGFGLINQMPDQFHPQKYAMRVLVDPPMQRRGIGGAIYNRLVEDLLRRNAIAVRTNAQESKTQTIEFLVRRGFTELEKEWESRLDIETFDFEPFAGAIGRVTSTGITLTTLAEELRRDPDCLPRLHEMHRDCERDIPSAEPNTDVPFELYVKQELESPMSLHDAYFIAKDGDRYVGESYLLKGMALPGLLYQGLTGVLPAYRGRGIAMALKIAGLRYAREHGYRAIRTGNNTTNRPMLRINEALGFVKQPVWIAFRKELA